MYSVDEFGYSMLPDHAFQREGGRMRLWGGGKGSAPNPNPGMIASAEAAKEIANIQKATAMEYLEFSKSAYSENKPFLQEIARLEADIMRSNKARADEYAAYERETFRPIEQQLVREAQEYNTDAKREQLAGLAKGDTATAFGVQRDMALRRMASFGINPSSGRFASLNQQLNLAQAAAEGGSANRARMQAEGIGYARMTDAANMGRGLAGNASTAYGVGIQAGNSAASNFAMPSQMMGAGYQQTSNMYGNAANAAGIAGGIYGQEFSARMQAYRAQQEAAGAFWGGVGSLLGNAAGAAIYKWGADGGKVPHDLDDAPPTKRGLHAGPGPVKGPGGPIDDKVPAMLSNGEYVIPADVVEKKGVKFFDEMVDKHHTPAAEQRKQKARKGIRRKS